MIKKKISNITIINLIGKFLVVIYIIKKFRHMNIVKETYM